MANVTTTDAFRTVQVFGPGIIADVMDVGFVVSPLDVYARVQFTIDQWQGDEYLPILQAMGDAIERIMAYPEVAAMAFEQDVNPSGLLKDVMVITVQAPSTQPGQFGPFYGEVRVPTYAFSAGAGTDYLINTPIAAELARLNALVAA